MPSLKDLFRTAAKATHPDHGGDPEAFRAVKDLYDAACRSESLGHKSAFTEEEHASTARAQAEERVNRFEQSSRYYDNIARQEGAQNHSGFRAWCKWHHRSTKDGRAWAEYKKDRADEAAAAPRQTGAGCTVRIRNGNQSSGASVDWPTGSAGVDQSSFVEWYQANHEPDECGIL